MTIREIERFFNNDLLMNVPVSKGKLDGSSLLFKLFTIGEKHSGKNNPKEYQNVFYDTYQDQMESNLLLCQILTTQEITSKAKATYNKGINALLINDTDKHIVYARDIFESIDLSKLMENFAQIVSDAIDKDINSLRKISKWIMERNNENAFMKTISEMYCSQDHERISVYVLYALCDQMNFEKKLREHYVISKETISDIKRQVKEEAPKDGDLDCQSIEFNLKTAQVFAFPPDDRAKLIRTLENKRVKACTMRIDFGQTSNTLADFYSLVVFIDVNNWHEFLVEGYQLSFVLDAEKINMIDVEIQDIEHKISWLARNEFVDEGENQYILSLKPLYDILKQSGEAMINRICFVYRPVNHEHDPSNECERFTISNVKLIK